MTAPPATVPKPAPPARNPEDSTTQAAAAAPTSGFAAWLSRDNNGLLLGAALIYLLLYLRFWPQATAIMDESAYLNMAWTMRHGTVYVDVAGISTVFTYPVGAHWITQYPPGMPAVLALVSFAGWNAALGTNLLVLLALFAVTVKILRALRLPAIFALLLLLHPTAVMYSRTVMSDLVSSLLIASGFLAYLHRRFALLGLLLGIAVLVRTASGVALPLFLLGILLDNTRSMAGRNEDEAAAAAAAAPPTLMERVREGALVCLSALPGVATAWWYQHTIQDGGWAKYSSGGQMGFHNFPHIFPIYFVSLMVLYPGMLLAPLFYRGRGRVALWGLTYGVVLFYSCYHFQDSTDSKLQSLILGQRYMLTAMPLFIAAYASLLCRITVRWSLGLRRAAIAVVTAALFVVAGKAHQVHAAYLQRGAEVRDNTAHVIAPEDILFANVHLAKMMHPAWTGPRRFVQFGTMKKSQLNMDLMKALRETEQGGAATNRQRRVIVAHWSRKYRPETETEHRLINSVTAAFITRRLEGSQNANDFDELEYLQIIAPRDRKPDVK